MRTTNKSQQMRDYYTAGKSIGEISKLIGVRYQFVYQVISRMKIAAELHELRKKVEAK